MHTQVRPAAGKLDEPCGAPTVATAASEWSPAERLVSGRAPKPECNKVACRCAVCSLWRRIRTEHIAWGEFLQRCSAHEANAQALDLPDVPVKGLGRIAAHRCMAGDRHKQQDECIDGKEREQYC
jgi:hypothetical protein